MTAVWRAYLSETEYPEGIFGLALLQRLSQNLLSVFAIERNSMQLCVSTHVSVAV
jgi:hypothetical protein